MPDFTPSFITIDPTTGKLAYVFPGGLIIPALVNYGVQAGTITQGAASAISFTDAIQSHGSFGKVIAYLDAFATFISAQANLFANGFGGGSQLQLGALENTPGSDFEDAVMTFHSAVNAADHAEIIVGAGLSKTLLKGDGSSDYLSKSSLGLIANFVNGPLPINGNFTVDAPGNYWFIGFGSCYSDIAQICAIGFGIDTSGTQGQAKAYFNEAASHKVVLPCIWKVNGLVAGNHTYSVHIDSTQTHTDINDFFTIFMIPAA